MVEIEVGPDWKSVEEIYLLVASKFQKSPFSAEELAQIRLGEGASRSAIQAETVSINSILKSACMYGLVARRGEQFHLTVLPDDPEELWNSTFSMRVKLLRETVAEASKVRPERLEKAETMELQGKEYIITYVGPETTRGGVDSFTFSVFNPEKHEGIVLQTRGRHIPIAKKISVELQSPQEDDTFLYKLVKEDPRRTERGLAIDIYLKVEFA